MQPARGTPSAAGANGLVEALQQLGFTDYEARAYLALAQSYLDYMDSLAAVDTQGEQV